MLRISKLTDYGTVILACLASQADRLWTAAEVAERTRVGLPTVSKLLKKLQRSGLVISTRGSHGGYQLACRRTRSARRAFSTRSKDRSRSPSAAVSTATAASNPTAASDTSGSA
jgi:DNA-binding IclR family transcriptional regulator